MTNSIPINITPPLTPLSDIKSHNGIFYAADEFNHRIVLFDKDWGMIKAIGGKGSGASEFQYPKSIAFDTHGNIFVTDCWNHRVQRFSPEGVFISSFGRHGSKAGELEEPFGIAVSKDNLIYVVDRGNHRVQVFDDKGISLGFFGSRGGVNEEEMAELYDFYEMDDKIVPRELFEYPTTIALKGESDIFVVDSGNHRIKRFNRSGRLLDMFGKRGAGECEFQYPHGIAIDEYENIFISDLNNNRIQRLTPKGEFISSFDNIEFPSAIYAKAGMILIGSIINGGIRELRYPSEITNALNKDPLRQDERYRRILINPSEEGDLPSKFLSALISHTPDVNNVNLIFKYLNTKAEHIESEILPLKEKLISLTTKHIRDRWILDNAALAKKDIGDIALEKGIYQFKDEEREIKKRLIKSYLAYKRILLKRCEVLNTLTDIYLKGDLPDDIKAVILKDSIDRLKKTGKYTRDLFIEKDRYERDAELRFRDPEGNNDAGRQAFEEGAAKVIILNTLLYDICITSKILAYSVYNTISILEKSSSPIPDTSIDSIKSDKELIESIRTIFKSFNNGWEFIFVGTGRVRAIANIIEPLKLLSSTQLFKDYIEQYPLEDINIGADVENILSDLAKKAADLDKSIRENEDKRGPVIEEISKIVIMIENGIIDREKEILLNRKLRLLNFNHALMKKEITKLYSRYSEAVVNIIVMLHKQLSLERDEKKRGEIEKELSDISSHIEEIITNKIKTDYKLFNQTKTKERESAAKSSLQDIINARGEVKRIANIREFIHLSLKNYEEISDILNYVGARHISDQKQPHKAFSIAYDKTITRFLDTERKLLYPGKIIAKGDILYIGEYTGCRVKKVTTEGDFITNIGGYGNLPGLLNMPAGIAVDKDEILYVCDEFNHRIQKFSKDGNFIGGFGSFGSGKGEFNMPWDIYIDPAGYLYITERGNNRVQKFTHDGEYILSFGRQGGGAGELHGPISILVKNNGDILINELFNNRLQLFDKDGKSLKSVDAPNTIDIAHDDRGYIYALSYTNPYISIYSEGLKLLERVRIGGEGGRLYSSFKFIDIASGYIFISDANANCVHRYKRW